jgi:RHS repeat-associated protein
VTLGNFKLSAIGQNAYYSEYPFPGGSFESENGGATGVQLADWLGTSRLFYSYTGGGFGQSGAHAPFGEAYAYNNGSPKDFTGQQNDGNMNNTTYYFPQRQYRSSQGRWLSPDPAGLAAADPTNPQSWNRYAYVLNNPLSTADSTGLLGDCEEFGDQGQACDAADNSTTFGSLDEPAPIDPLSLPSDAFGTPPPVFDSCGGGDCPLPEFSGSTSEVVNVFGGRPDDVPLLTVVSMSGTAGNTKRSNPCAGRRGSDLVYSDTAKQHIIDEHINGNPAIKSQYLFNDPVSTTMKFAAVQAYNSFTFNTGSFNQRPKSLNIEVTTFVPPWLPIPVSTGGFVHAEPFIGVDKNSGGDTNFNTLVLLKDCVSVVTSHPGLP